MSEKEKKALSEENLDNISGGYLMSEYKNGGRTFDLTDEEVDFLKTNGFEGRYGWNGEKHFKIKKKDHGTAYFDLENALKAGGFRNEDLSSDR